MTNDTKMGMMIEIIIPSLENIAEMEDERYLNSLFNSARFQKRKLGIYIKALELRLKTMRCK